MIPTRLNFQINSGVVAGFNRTTGSIIVIHNRPKFLGVTNKDLHYDRLNNYCSSLSSTVKWMIPTVSDVAELKDILAKQTLLSGTVLTEKLPNTNDCQGVCLYQDRLTNSIAYHVVSSMWYNDGFIFPVLYINGRNCESF